MSFEVQASSLILTGEPVRNKKAPSRRAGEKEVIMDEIFQVVGTRTLNFVGNDGKPVQKMQWFFTFSARNVDGVATEKVTINTADALQLSWLPKVGDLCRCVYNKYGKVSSFVQVTAPA